MPYRIDIRHATAITFDRVVELGALDAEALPDGGLAALMPDSVAPATLAAALGVEGLSISPAVGRDDGSVWVLGPRPVRIGQLLIVPDGADAGPDALKLIDAAAFGTGLHPTTALCLEVLQDAVQARRPDSVLDVGTGSGVLALAALLLGVPHAVGLDIDDEALRVAAANARINALDPHDSLDARLRLVRGGPKAVAGTWPLVLANVLAAPLIEMAPALVRRVGHHGELVLSGIPASAGDEVSAAYRRLGMQYRDTRSRAGWVALVLQATW